MSNQLGLDFRPPTRAGIEHRGPIQDDEDGLGCDCCAQRLRCGICGERFLGRLYAYYYRYDTRDDDGYMVGRNGAYGDLAGPCCLPEDPKRFDELNEDYDYDYDDLVRKGEFVYGSWGALVSRIWIPAEWPTGESPHDKHWREQSASSRKRRRTNDAKLSEQSEGNRTEDRCDGSNSAAAVEEGEAEGDGVAMLAL